MGEQDEGGGAGQKPLPELGRGSDWLARATGGRFGILRVVAGLGYCQRAARLGQGLAVPTAIMLLLSIWYQVDSYFYHSASMRWEPEATTEQPKHPSGQETLEAMFSRQAVGSAPTLGLYHLPSLRANFDFVISSQTPPAPWLQPAFQETYYYVALLASALLAALVVLLLLRAVNGGPTRGVRLSRLFRKRAPAWLGIWACALLAQYAWVPLFWLDERWRPAHWMALACSVLISLAVLLAPYTTVGLGLGFRRGLVGAVRLIWRRPVEALVLVLVWGLARSVVYPLGSRNTFTLWMPPGGEPLPHAIGCTVADLALMALPALVTAWTMAAFLLFVMDHAEEAGARVEAQAADVPHAAKEPA